MGISSTLTGNSEFYYELVGTTCCFAPYSDHLDKGSGGRKRLDFVYFSCNLTHVTLQHFTPNNRGRDHLWKLYDVHVYSTAQVIQEIARVDVYFYIYLQALCSYLWEGRYEVMDHPHMEG